MRAREFTINIPINIKINGDGEPEISTDQDEESPDDSGQKTMVPPLQQKLEILKKSAGLNSVFDQEADDDEPLN
jgi:hypothetical protein